MRHHDILPGHDYCLILDKLETKLPPSKRIYVKDADACSRILDPSFSQNGFWTFRFQSTPRQDLAFCIRGGEGRKFNFACGIELNDATVRCGPRLVRGEFSSIRHRTLVFFHHRITLSALASTLGGI